MKYFIQKYLLYTLAVIGAWCVYAPAFADKIDVAQLRQDAERGDPKAQVDLAMAYHDGIRGQKSNDIEAVTWFRKAAAQGDLEGQYNLGIAYYHGFGVKKDLTEAVTWFRKAAEQGYADAEYILACAYENGLGGLKEDDVQAYLWLSLAEAQGNKDAGRERISLESTMIDKDVVQAKILVQARLPKHN